MQEELDTYWSDNVIFRIFNYLSLKTFFKGIFLNQRKIKKTAEKKLRDNSNKKFLHFVGMGRTSLSLILKYLKKNNKKKMKLLCKLTIFLVF